jgi:N-methylhydantoinase A
LNLDVSAAVVAGASFAEQAATDVREAYWQALRITTANMSSALRMVSLEQGHDPREMTLIAYGGAGGLHAALCADELGIPRVVIPREPGVFSAFGMVSADVQRDYVRTFICRMGPDAEEGVETRLRELMEQAGEEFRRFGFAEEPSIDATLDVRYVGQAHSVPVPIKSVVHVDLSVLEDAFHDLHRRRFGFAEPGSDVEIENVRVQARIHRGSPPLKVSMGAEEGFETGQVFLGADYEAGFTQRAALRPGSVLPGPAVIEEATATTVVPLGWTAKTDEDGVLWLTRV